MSFYTNYHLAISKKEHVSRLKNELRVEGVQKLSYRAIPATYADFQSLLSRYGGAWGWDKRPKYFSTRSALVRRLEQDETRLYVFYKEDKEIGYCLVTAPAKFRGKNLRENKHIIEIENIALAAEVTGQGYGRYFLQEMFSILFEHYETIYLSSRSTNHSGVIPFYLRMGMSIIHTEYNVPSDLVENEKITA